MPSNSTPYDELDAPQQAVVRFTWNEDIQATLAALDLSAEFAAAGHRYAELDEQGRVRIVSAG